ncbi:MAG: flagellar biosynthesis protein FlgD [Fibrobacteres bacterium]|nr:flagellar biosynthesis protein FlgD [Fibrobacterota bacterium]
MTTVTKPLATDINSILHPASATPRKVTADLSGSEVSSAVTSEGDQKIFQNGTKELGKQDFLQLLVTQMRYQDPLAPQDNQQFIAQLAQFSSLEGTQNITKSVEDLSKKLESMVSGQANSATSISNSSATSLIGKSVRVMASDIVYDPAQTAPIDINVHVDDATSVLTLVDSEGTIVNALPLTKSGELKVSWNGLKMDGTKVPGGKYALKVTSRDGTKETGYTFFEDKVKGLNYTKTGVRLEVRGQAVGLDQVVHVGEPETAAI